MSKAPEFDIIVHGASGFTGRLVVEHLLNVASDRGVTFALSGRDVAKLERVAEELGAGSSLTLIHADATDRASIDAMVARTRSVLTTAGPFQLYGEPVVAACAAAGVDYLDLTGEVAWMRRMIDRYEEDANRSGARILFSSGFDSIPFELGVLFLQEQAIERFGRPVDHVMARITGFQGSFSGGTVASGVATAAAVAKDPSIAAILADPFALTPGFAGRDQVGEEASPTYDEVIGQWTAPFVMAPINTRNVQRSNFLQEHRYGRDFRYDERIAAGPGENGREMAQRLMAMTSRTPGPDSPKPGEGPSREDRDAGYYDILFTGLIDDERRIAVTAHGDRDPGYGSTSKIIAETAILLRQTGRAIAPGFWTPGAALGTDLVEQLGAHAGLSFAVA